METVKNTNKLLDNILKKGIHFGTDYPANKALCIFIILVFFLVTSYFYMLNHLEPIKEDWANQRCRPNVMPFVGIINKPDDQTAFEFTKDNFSDCIQNIVTSAMEYATLPFTYLMTGLNDATAATQVLLNDTLAMIDNIRVALEAIITAISDMLFNVGIAISAVINIMNELFTQGHTIIYVILYFFVGVFVTFMSSFSAMMTGFFMLTMATFAVLTEEFWGAYLWEIIGDFAISMGAPELTNPFTLGVGIAATIYGVVSEIQGFVLFLTVFIPELIFFIVQLVSYIILQTIGTQAFGMTFLDLPTPSFDFCFDKNTLIQLKNEKQVCIKDINIGDLLFDNSRVTGKMVSLAKNIPMSTLNGVIVSSSHHIYHNKLGWIHVEQHPDSVLIEKYEEKHIYCLNTDSKTIRINKMIFSDWDELDDIDLEKLGKNCSDLPESFNNKDINKFIDNGLVGSTIIKLAADQVEICELAPGDILDTGEIVTSIIVIQGNNKPLTKYVFDNTIIVGFNLKFDKKPLGVKLLTLKKPDVLYQMITTTGYFNIDDIRVKHYNAAIEDNLK